jgi:putative ABC transport system permease protein
MKLFLSEAALIGVIGATIGVLLGMGLGSLLISLLGGSTIQAAFGGSIEPVFLTSDIIFVWVFTVGISTIAGFYPAWRASRLDPVVALRKE